MKSAYDIRLAKKRALIEVVRGLAPSADLSVCGLYVKYYIFACQQWEYSRESHLSYEHRLAIKMMMKNGYSPGQLAKITTDQVRQLRALYLLLFG